MLMQIYSTLNLQRAETPRHLCTPITPMFKISEKIDLLSLPCTRKFHNFLKIR